ACTFNLSFNRRARSAWATVTHVSLAFSNPSRNNDCSRIDPILPAPRIAIFFFPPSLFPINTSPDVPTFNDEISVCSANLHYERFSFPLCPLCPLWFKLLTSAQPHRQAATTPAFRTISTISRPIGNDAVAAGDGTFSTCRNRSRATNRKSSTSVPSAATACARTPDPPAPPPPG